MTLPIEYITSDKLVEYPEALAFMEQRVEDIIAGRAPECIWFLEHPPLYTSGTSAKSSDLLGKHPFPVYNAGRGGQWTYHGPGQRVAYVMLDLKKRGAMDVRRYVQNLEQWLIATLAVFGVEGFTREGRVGVWVSEGSGIRGQEPEEKKRNIRFPTPDPRPPTPELKIAALGIRVRKWVTYNGICLNVNPDLSHYAGIVPCGISEHGVTSLKELGIKATLKEVDEVLKKIIPAEWRGLKLQTE